MRLLRPTWTSQGRRVFFTASAALLLAAPLFADPSSKTAASHKNGSKSSSTPGSPAPAGDSARDPKEFADAYPSVPKPAAPDLLLKKDDERKAEAMAAFSEGLVAEDNAEQEKMIAAYRKALELDPTYAELAVKVAYELARRNDPSSAIEILKDTIKAAPKEPTPYIYLSQLYSKDLNKPDVALKYAEQALSLAPDNFAAHAAVYEVYFATGQTKKAEQVLELAAKNDHADAKYWAQLGDLYARLYLKEDGSAEPAQVEKMNVVYRKAAELGKDDPSILTKVADYFVLSKQVKDAIPYYRSVLTLDPGGDDSSVNDAREKLTNVRDKLARSYLATGQRDEGIRYLEDIVKDNPLRFDTYEKLGELYEESGDIDKALTNYEHSLLLDASEPRNHLRLTQLLLSARHYERAVEIMQMARKKFPDHPDVTFFLALSLSAAKRHNEAMSAFADAQAEAEASREDLLTPQFYLLYGEAAEQAGQVEKAAQLIKQSLDMEPSGPNAAEACNYLGYMWVDRGEHLEEAGDLIKKAIAADPEKGEYLDSLGWYYYKKGDAEHALPELLRAQESIIRETKKDDATVLEHIGDTYQKLGKTAEALSFWQKSLALEENKKVAEKIEAAKQKVTSAAPVPVPDKQ
jgi:tetratricopeptide (TPR) repeat protein